MHVDPKCHLDLGEGQFATFGGVQGVESLPQSYQLVANLNVGQPNRLRLILQAKLLDGQVLLEHLGGAGQRHLDVVEHWDPLTLDQVLHCLHRCLQVFILGLKGTKFIIWFG